MIPAEHNSDWSRLKSGDPAALESIYRQHVRALYRYGQKVTPDVNLIQDSIQDLFLEIWRHRVTLSDTPFPRYYLLRALRNKLVRAQGQRSYISEGELRLASGHLEAAYVELDIMARESEAQHRQTLKQLLEKLPSRQQEAIYLRFYQNIPYEHIAEMMGMNYQSVLNIMQRALKALRKGYAARSSRS
ncbi:RNA polymerase sigma factor [Chitinophaga lutea]